MISNLIEIGEVVDNYRYGKRDDQHAADTADGAYELAPRRLRIHVTVAYGSHGDGCPPKRLRNTGKHDWVVLLLREVRETGKDEDSDCEKRH